MINLRRVAASAVAIALGSFVMFSCTQEDLETTPDNQISETALAQFQDMGFDASDLSLELRDINPFDDKGATMNYVLEGDIVISPEQLADMISSESIDVQGEQYRTNALVSAPRNISIIGFTGSGNALTSKMRTGLQWAVNNYNRLNLGISFTLTFGTNYQSKDMVVYNNNQSGGGGSAGFPSGGLPFKFVQINAGTDGFSTNVNEHVITHEIGHSVGFRHSDYFNRSLSCGSGGNEGTAGVGATLIPGTNQFDATSIMAACFSSTEDGEFNANDITALNFLY